MANGGKVLGFICPMAILGELLFSFELCILSCDEERGMSYGGMIVHDSYVPSITNFLASRVLPGVCVTVQWREGIVLMSSIASLSPACCEVLEGMQCPQCEEMPAAP
jgi:hypothetical protein